MQYIRIFSLCISIILAAANEETCSNDGCTADEAEDEVVLLQTRVQHHSSEDGSEIPAERKNGAVPTPPFFKTWDKDGNNHLSKMELKDGLTEAGHAEEVIQEEYDFLSMDTNGDESLSLEEILAWAAEHATEIAAAEGKVFSIEDAEADDTADQSDDETSLFQTVDQLKTQVEGSKGGAPSYEAYTRRRTGLDKCCQNCRSMSFSTGYPAAGKGAGKSGPSDTTYGSKAMSVTFAPPKAETRPCWMKNLLDTVKLNQITWPGTHDTMTFPHSNNLLLEGKGNALNTQTWYLRRQLEAGIRFLDMRITTNGYGIYFHHGAHYVSHNKLWDDGLMIIKQFLDDNPSEVILAKWDKTGVTEAQMTQYFTPYVNMMGGHRHYNCDKTYGDASAAVWLGGKTLGPLRGKMVNIGEFMGCAWETRDYTADRGGRLTGTDVFTLDSFHLDDKKGFIRKQLQRGGPIAKLFNFVELSGAVGLFPGDFARGFGGHDVLGTNDIPFEFGGGHFGIVSMDFPSEKLIAHLIFHGHNGNEARTNTLSHDTRNCWGHGTGCLEGTSCNNCCYGAGWGDTWVPGRYWFMTYCGYATGI